MPVRKPHRKKRFGCQTAQGRAQPDAISRRGRREADPGSPRARGTPGVRRTHGPRCVAASRRSGCSLPQVRRRPASRARCLRLAPRTPRWAGFATHRFRPSTAPDRWHGGTALAAKRPGRELVAPGPRSLGRRVGCALHPATATASRSRFGDASRKRPRRTGLPASMRPVRQRGITFFAGVGDAFETLPSGLLILRDARLRRTPQDEGAPIRGSAQSAAR